MKKQWFRVFIIVTALVLMLAGTVSAEVGYLGPAATYTEEASILFFGDKETLVPMKTVPETLAGVKDGIFRYAVVPIENTVGGPVYNYLDAVIGDPGFCCGRRGESADPANLYGGAWRGSQRYKNGFVASAGHSAGQRLAEGKFA